jgi:hypothetical protein
MHHQKECTYNEANAYLHSHLLSSAKKKTLVILKKMIMKLSKNTEDTESGTVQTSVRSALDSTLVNAENGNDKKIQNNTYLILACDPRS